MSKKTIVLADNSYTIRRIVELSFSEEEDIDLVSFENSMNLREKLLELRPAVVLVDIKLPEFSGYEVCHYVNSTEGLKQTRVFLLKGGFEPVDEAKLQGLRFEDIITKPFDSNALVSTIKNLLSQISAGTAPAPPAAAPAAPAAVPAPEVSPPSMPEDFPEIGGVPDAGEEISFSDVQNEIEGAPNIMAESPQAPPMPSFPDDEVMPSEEITYQSDREDELASPEESPEDLINPFADEAPAAPAADEFPSSITEEEMNIRMNIKQQERELDMASLTQEELEIKHQIGEKEKVMFQQQYGTPEAPLQAAAPVEPEPKDEEETADMFKQPDLDSGGLDDIPEVGAEPDMFPSFDEPEPPSEPVVEAPEPPMQQIPDLEASEVEQEMGLGPEIPEPPVTQKMPAAPQMPSFEEEDLSGVPEDYSPPSPFEEEVMPAVDTRSMEAPSFEPEAPSELDFGVPEPEPTFAAEQAPAAPEISYEPASPFEDDLAVPTIETPPVEPPSFQEEAAFAPPEEPEPAIPDFGAPEPEPAPMPTFAEEPEPPVVEYQVPPTFEDKFEAATPPDMPAPPDTATPPEMPMMPETPTAPDMPAMPEMPPVMEEAPVMEEPVLEEEPPVYEVPPVEEIPVAPPVQEMPVMEEPVAPPQPEAPAFEPEAPAFEPEPTQAAVEIPKIDTADLQKQVEDKLSAAIKEMLWEIVPPLAEKIINREIERIKEEVSKSFR